MEMKYCPGGSVRPLTTKLNGTRQFNAAADVVTDSGLTMAIMAIAATRETSCLVMTPSSPQ